LVTSLLFFYFFKTFHTVRLGLRFKLALGFGLSVRVKVTVSIRLKGYG